MAKTISCATAIRIRSAMRAFLPACCLITTSSILFACPALKEGQVCQTTYDCVAGLHCVPDPQLQGGACSQHRWSGCHTVCRSVCLEDGGLSDGGVGRWCDRPEFACVYDGDVTNTGENWDNVTGQLGHYCISNSW